MLKLLARVLFVRAVLCATVPLLTLSFVSAPAIIAADDVLAAALGADVTPPKVISKQEPEYTETARKAGLEGSVELGFVVAKDGLPTDIHVTKSLDPGLDQKAIEAVSNWRFQPAQKDGQPVAFPSIIRVEFRLFHKVPDGLVLPVLISKVPAEYTDTARKAGIQGAVELKLTIGKDGIPVDIQVLKSLDPGLDQKAIEAVSQWRYHPAQKDGQPIPMNGHVSVTFRLPASQ